MQSPLKLYSLKIAVNKKLMFYREKKVALPRPFEEKWTRGIN